MNAVLQVGEKLSFTTWAGVAVLDLSDNNLSDAACARVVQSLDAAHIRKLDLSMNHGGLRLCAALASSLPAACRLQVTVDLLLLTLHACSCRCSLFGLAVLVRRSLIARQIDCSLQGISSVDLVVLFCIVKQRRYFAAPRM